jgi:D-3-phosphoglycerate dehydrogenase
MKPTARIVNTSRGGVVDEKSLYDALVARDIAGAALDVYEQEPPPKDHPLLKLDTVVLTPHLAASTEEAQLKVSVDIAEQFVDYFKNGIVRNAVNLAATGDPALAPYMRLAGDLGGLAAQLVDGRVRRIEAVYAGQIGSHDVGTVTQSAVTGALRPMLGDEVNVVNARYAAKEAGIEILERKHQEAGDYKSLVSVQVETEKGLKIVSGTILEGRNPRIVRIDDLDIDLKPSRHMLCMHYRDVPGVVGKVGTLLGKNGINIARMEVGRTERGKQATTIVTLDEPAPPPVVEEIRKAIPLDDIRPIFLP